MFEMQVITFSLFEETIEFLSSFECLLIKLSKSGRVALGKSRRRYYWSAKDGCGAMTVCHCVPPATKIRMERRWRHHLSATKPHWWRFHNTRRTRLCLAVQSVLRIPRNLECSKTRRRIGRIRQRIYVWYRVQCFVIVGGELHFPTMALLAGAT